MPDPVFTAATLPESPGAYGGDAKITRIGVSLLHKGDHLYYMGETLTGVFQVKVGAIKLYRTSKNGEQRIAGFYTAGEVIGVDAIADGVSRYGAVALDTTRVAAIPLGAVFGGRDKFDVRELVSRMSVNANRECDLAKMLTLRSADRRLAWFLLEFGERLRKRGLSVRQLTLPMTWTDIAQYLGLALETVCREMAGMEAAGVIRKKRRTVTVLDAAALEAIFHGQSQAEKPVEKMARMPACNAIADSPRT